jgi:hypothetical protein
VTLECPGPVFKGPRAFSRALGLPLVAATKSGRDLIRLGFEDRVAASVAIWGKTPYGRLVLLTQGRRRLRCGLLLGFTRREQAGKMGRTLGNGWRSWAYWNEGELGRTR